MHHSNTIRAMVAVGTALIANPAHVSAGDLDPPPGPVQPTNRAQISAQYITSLPYTISEAGSYVLTSNLTGQEGQHGIVINADDVTLDLNGFALIGVPGSLWGITGAAGVRNLAIRNGTIREWGCFGVAGAFENSQFDGLRLYANGTTTDYDGLKVGLGNIIKNCTAQGNAGHGMHAGSHCLVVNCVARNNGVRGFCISASVISECAACENTGDGIYADEGGNTIVNCTANDNGGDGIHTSTPSLIRGNAAVGNTGQNIYAPDSTVIENHAP